VRKNIKNYPTSATAVVAVFYKSGMIVKSEGYKRQPFLADLKEMAIVYDAPIFDVVTDSYVKTFRQRGDCWSVTLERI
jgi:hypothetical protein